MELRVAQPGLGDAVHGGCRDDAAKSARHTVALIVVMMSSTFGAPLGGTTLGGQYGFESLASSLITPPNLDGGAGSCFPSIVVVALGEPGVPVIC